jgi:acyl-coenzyme A synthetase/AMP-(fatty) acid ligase
MPAFNLQKFCSYNEDYRITFANVVPPVVLLLAKHPIVEVYDFSSLKMLNCGAAPLTKELATAVYERIKVPIKQGYGLTEKSPTTHLQAWDQWATFGSIGHLLPNQVAKYVDPDEKEVPVGMAGELWLKGPNVFKGYYKNPRATENTFSADGFFKTGVDERGNFYITDRIQEIIQYKEFQVAPAELEGLLLGHPKINDVAVLGVFDESIESEVPRAYVLPVRGVARNADTAREICDWLDARVPAYKRLRGEVRWVNSIPKSPSGKILRRALRKQVQNGCLS